MRKIILFLLQFYLFSGIAYAQTVSDYLILQDIGQYKLTKGFLFRGRIVGAEPKVSRAGDDASGYYTSYEISYAGGEGYSAPKVEVRVYDSTQWLLHEVEDIFRSNKRLGELITGTEIREINGNRILNWISYAWVSSNVVVYITWTPKPEIQNPEPLEIIQAYLQKFPSTIPATLVLDSAHNEQWIKDEMDRRLWLCDKWFAQLQVGNVELTKVLRQSVNHMNVFLDYREKYYGIEAATEKQTLSEYLQAKNKAGIKNKLEEYKTWWAANKDKPINL